jgi:dihydrofolate reductase
MSIRICAIVAMSDNRVIGRDGGLPWHIPEDLKNFKKITMSKPIIMGRKTFDSIGRPLPGRDNLVLSRTKLTIMHKANADGTPGHIKHLAPPHPVQEALHLAKALAREANQNEIMIIGGGEIYHGTLAITDRIYLTQVHQTIEGDTLFPALNKAEWRETAREDHAGFSFITLDRIKPL